MDGGSGQLDIAWKLPGFGGTADVGGGVVAVFGVNALVLIPGVEFKGEVLVLIPAESFHDHKRGMIADFYHLYVVANDGHMGQQYVFADKWLDIQHKFLAEIRKSHIIITGFQQVLFRKHLPQAILAVGEFFKPGGTVLTIIFAADYQCVHKDIGVKEGDIFGIQILGDQGFGLLTEGGDVCKDGGVPADVCTRLCLFGFGIGEEADADDQNGNEGDDQNPEAGLSVAEDIFDTLLHADLTEGQGTGSNHVPGDAAGEEGFGVFLLLTAAKVLYDTLVTGQLNVPAQQNVGNPDQRMEPVKSQQSKAQRLPPMVLTFQVGTFMGQHIGGIFRMQGGRQVNNGFTDTQNEGGVDVITDKQVVLDPDGGLDFIMKTAVGHKGVEHYGDYAQEPDGADNGKNIQGSCLSIGNLDGHGAIFSGNGAIKEGGGVHGVVFKAGGNFFSGDAQHSFRDRLGIGNQTQRTFNGDRTHKPEGDQAP